MTDAADLPKLAELPIPPDVAVGKGWTPFMAEMADHIGAYATLQILDRYGGEFFYVPHDAARNKLRDLIGEERTRTFSFVYGGNRLELPLGKAALTCARRAGILAAVRQGALTGDDAARILRINRTYLPKLLRDTDEGVGVPATRIRGGRVDTRQLYMFED